MSISQNFPTSSPSLSLDFANVKKLDPRVTFARATTGAYYDGQTVAKAEENLLLRSQEFDNSAWVKVGSSVTVDSTTAPDGTTTADKLVESNITEVHTVYQTIGLPSAIYTFSWYAKAGGRSWVHTRGSLSPQTYFDVTNGVLGTVPLGTIATITSVGDGWYKCSVTTTVAISNVQIAVGSADNTDSTTGDGVSGVYIWGAQLEQRDTVTAYTPTTTQPITNYIPVLQTASANVARFDHNPVTGESLGLLVEEQRSNLLLRSEEFGNAAWTKTRSSITANTIVAPDGTLTGDKLVEDTTASNTHTLLQNVTINNATVYSFSFYAKAAERSLIRVNSPSIGVDLWFNLATGLLQITTLGTGTITPVGNGWYRIVATGTSNTTSGAATIFLSNGATHIYTGNGYSGIYIWGAQLEAGAKETTYIKTVASQVTRSADSAIDSTIDDWCSQGEGTLYVDFAFNEVLNNSRVLEIGNGTTSNFTALYTAVTDLKLFTTANGTNVVNATAVPSLSTNTDYSVAVAYNFNDYATVANGGTVVTDTSANVPVVNKLVIGGNTFNGLQKMNGTIKKIAYYPARLTNAQLQAITG